MRMTIGEILASLEADAQRITTAEHVPTDELAAAMHLTAGLRALEHGNHGKALLHTGASLRLRGVEIPRA